MSEEAKDPAGYLPTACCVCGRKFSLRPSISMELGMNSGHCTCPGCLAFLHVEQNSDRTAMTTEVFNDYLARTERQPCQ